MSGGVYVRSLMPTVRGVRETGPGTPRKKARWKAKRDGTPSGTSQAANKPLSKNELMEITAGYIKWHLERPVPLARKVIAALFDVHPWTVDAIATGKQNKHVPPMQPPKEMQ
jgi:hypothetical protein